MAAYAGLSVFVIIFGLVLVIVWIILPFAIIGTKPLLKQLLAEQKRTNELLELRRTSSATSSGSASQLR